MRIVKTLLSLILAMSLLTFSQTNFVQAIGCAEVPDPPPVSYELGKSYFKYSTSTGDSSSGAYFTNIVVDIDPSAGVPSSYVYKGMELAVYDKVTNAYVSYIGSVNQSCIKADLGDPNAYRPSSYYEVKYRVNYTALSDPPQEVRSSWRTVPVGTGLYFKVETPNPMNPAANPNNNYSWVESKTNASYVFNDFSGVVNSLVLSEQSSEILSIMSEAWYSSKIERTITGSPKETFSGNPTYKASFGKEEILSLVNGANRKTYPVKLELFSSNQLVSDLEVNQIVNLTVIKGIIENFFDLQVSQSGNSHTVTLSQKASLSAPDKSLLDNSLALFGVDLNRPYFVITDSSTTYVEDYSDKVQLSLNTPTAFTFTGTNPIFRIGYIGKDGKKGYTFSYPMAGLLNPKILGISEGQTLSTPLSSYGLSFEVRGRNNLFRFPTTAAFKWPEYVGEGIAVDVFAKKLLPGETVVADRTTYFNTETLYSATGQASNQLDGLVLNTSGNYVVGIRARNRLGEVAYDFKQFNLMLNGDTRFLTVTNNANFEIDDTSIRYNSYLSTPHGMNLLVNGLISVKTAFNVAHRVIFLGTDSGTGPVAKMYNTELAQYAAIDLSTLGMSQVKNVQPYLNGFLVSGIGGSRGMVYINLSDNTITTVTGIGNQVYAVLTDGATVYAADDAGLYAGVLQGTNYKQVSTISLSSLFTGTAKVKSISKVGDKLYVAPDLSYGSSQVPIAIVSIE